MRTPMKTEFLWDRVLNNMNFEMLKSALVSAVLMALVQVAGYIIGIGNIFAIDWKVMANMGVIALLTGLVSVVKNLLTTDNGNFAGIIKVKE